MEACRLHGLAATRASLASGLPLVDGRLTLDLAERAAARAGMVTRLERVAPEAVDPAALPAILVIAFGFASLGMGITSYLKSFQQMEWVQFVMLPMFLFSATFYPLTVYPEPIQWFIQALPLWHGVELVRGLTTGALTPAMLLHLLYFLVMIAVGLVFTTRRLKALFLD